MTSSRPCWLVAGLVLLGISHLLAQQDTRWFKGNLHTHTYWSDGDEFPEMVLDWYKTRGYDFVALSDHNTMAGGEKWKKITRSKMYEDAFQKYLEKFGPQWVTYKTDSGRILVKLKTLSEYKEKMSGKDFLIIPSEEITDRFEGKPIHMNATNLQSVLPPQGGSSVSETMQRNVDAVLKQRKDTGIPMFPHINHPNFYFAISTQDMIDLRGERFFEVYNGHPLVHNYGDSLHPGTEAMWDEINIAYAKGNQPLLFGLATDDSHSYRQFGTEYSNAGRGWVMVQADSLQAHSLISAMEAGKFYASSGVLLKTSEVRNNQLEIEIQQETGITYKIEFVGVSKDATKSKVLASVDGTKANFLLTSNYLFVRARITSNKVKTNPYQVGEYEMAWTQPVSLH
jgi:hypothetical protein